MQTSYVDTKQVCIKFGKIFGLTGLTEISNKRNETISCCPLADYLLGHLVDGCTHTVRNVQVFSESAPRSVLLCLWVFYLVCEAIGTAATPVLLCQPREIVKMIVEKQLECRLAGETEVLGEKTCPSATFVHHKIPHDDQIRVWTQTAAVENRRLTAWAMVRPFLRFSNIALNDLITW
jgi:hypothetical protein